ncbi:MAG: glycosyl transferase [Eubacteriales bacterium]|nr:glycosyl transferase [Eubacteriales bacterium]
MQTTVFLIVVPILLLAGVVVFLWGALVRSQKKQTVNVRDAFLSSEELEAHAKAIAIHHAVTNRKNYITWPIPRMNDNYNLILATYMKLNLDVQKKRVVPPAAEWLLDNFYMVEEQVKVLRRDFSRKSYLRLPILRTGTMKGYARIYAIATELISHSDGQVDDATLVSYLNAYQTHSILLDREIGAVPMVLMLAIIEYLRHLCESVEETLLQWDKANQIVDRWMENQGEDTDGVARLIAKSLYTLDEVDPTFIEHLFYRLRRSGRSYVNMLRVVDEQLEILRTVTTSITQKEPNAQSMSTVSMSNCISSIQFIATINGAELFDSISHIEQILANDPDGTYPLMDVATRGHYRNRVEELSLALRVSELHIAREAVELAQAADHHCMADDGLNDKRCMRHVGFYLLGKGLPELIARQKRSHKILPSIMGVPKRKLGMLYFGSIGVTTFLLTGIAIQYAALRSPIHTVLFCLLAGICVLVPSMEVAVNVVNWVVCKALKPTVFPRLALKEGIPDSMSTIVAVPTMLPDVKRTLEIIANLEGQYLRNREKNLYFALIGAFKDSDSITDMEDESIIYTAMNAIAALNQKYAQDGNDIFYLFHRARQFDPKNNKWISWERKRGALMEFNALVSGAADTDFAYSSCATPPFANIHYIITLDSDTLLPMGMARRMIGTMAHPLNRPLIDLAKGIVVEGYGLMQPRIDVDCESSNKTFFSRVFAGHEGLDPYTNAISDVYQDLFGEGIFTGKGIYDLKVFQTVLKNAIPDNTILSHDLLEGSYVRTGLATDLRLIDSYPSHYNSFSARLHRWVRGDWQLLPLLFNRIHTRSQVKINNPLTRLSRWKIADNMRRSILAPALMTLAVLAFTVLPGNLLVWLGYMIGALATPFFIALIQTMLVRRPAGSRVKRYIPVMQGLKATLMQLLITFTMLPYQTYQMVNAITTTLYRVMVSKQNMLQWIPSADVEKAQKSTLSSYWAQMWVPVLSVLGIPLLTAVLKPEAWLLSLCFALLWSCAPLVAYAMSREAKTALQQPSQKDARELRTIARKTWRYFEEFTTVRSHFLPPDNDQLDPPRGIARRTSPTNIGLGLLAVLAARDFGYISTSKMAELLEQTITTVEGLPKWNGHLQNWYDIRSLQPLQPGYISTVDSGNLVGYLITLRQGLKEYLESPLLDARLVQGIEDTLYCAGAEGAALYRASGMDKVVSESGHMDLPLWSRRLNELLANERLTAMHDAIWKGKARGMLLLFTNEFALYMPGIHLLETLPGETATATLNTNDRTDWQAMVAMLTQNPALVDLPKQYGYLVSRVNQLIRACHLSDGEQPALSAWLIDAREQLEAAHESAAQLVDRITSLMARVQGLVNATDFAPLYVKSRQLFSIGFAMDDQKLSKSYYDLLASEARQTSYIGIAKGQIPPEHWFRMGRALTVVDGYKGLVSWTGTMFEYLMPLLVMKSYKNTLLDETYSFVIKSQIKYGKQKNMPWGVSESCFNVLDHNQDYQYKAVGIPWLGLKRGLTEDTVVAPYATFLALLVNPEAAIRNIRTLQSEGLDGSHGFYEAADYTPERLPFENKRAIIKSFMAHHQGMSLLAIDDCLRQHAMQRRFHADAEMNAARLLLQEKIPSSLLFTKEARQKTLPFKGMAAKESSPVRSFTHPDPRLPKAHILSNGNYTIFITDRGTGYSKNRLVNVSRWRADGVLNPYGMFFYIRNNTTNTQWSATYAPLRRPPETYKVVFTSDKAMFKRTDGQIETKTEVIVASGDNVEIRRISLKNIGAVPCEMDVTSYFEVVLASQASDQNHPAFSNLFIETSFQKDRLCLIANRRPRSEADKHLWVANTAVIEGQSVGDMQFETDRMQWIGRGHTLQSPAVMERNKPLAGTVGAVLDPVMSLRARVSIEPGKTAVISFIVAVSENKELLLALADKYHAADGVEKAFQLALTRSQVESSYLNLKASEMELYQDMISDLVFLSHTRKANQSLIAKNRQGQPSLWKYGISGDLPIVLVNLEKMDQLDVLYDVLKAQEYWRLMNLSVDLVIVSEEAHSYSLPLHTLISDIVLSGQTHTLMEIPKDIYLLEGSKVTPEDRALLHAIARVIVKGDGTPLSEQMNPPPSAAQPQKRLNASAAATCEPIPLKNRVLSEFNGLGGFSADENEYVIQLDDGQNTPAPWVNVIANPAFGFIVSEAGSGYVWAENSHENKLTPWSNDAVCDSPGEAIYITDADTGEIWSPTPMPIREREPYLIRHGFGYTVFEHNSHGIMQDLTQFVPVQAPIKISILRIHNATALERHLTITYYMQPVLGVSPQETAMHVTSSVSVLGAMILENHYNENWAGKVCFVYAAGEQRSVTGDRKDFFGNGDMAFPDSLRYEALSGEVGVALDPCAAIQGNWTLAPNESKDIVLMLGVANDSLAVEALISQYGEPAGARNALADVMRFWKTKLNIVQVDVPSVAMKRMLNGWLQYQVISCRLWARTGIYQSGGAFGFRDQLQDCISIAHTWPEATRAQILLHAKHQFLEGDVLHWWHEPQGKGTRTHVSDDLLWLPYATVEYIRITGDAAILNEVLPFVDAPVLSAFEDERYITPGVSSTTATLLEHCIRAVEKSLRFGIHGLPLMGSGDWNDSMNTVGNRGQGESVWLGWFLAVILEKFGSLCRNAGDTQRADRFTSIRADLTTAIEQTAWDGSWYRRAYFDNGTPLGSVQNSECRIDSIAQSWSVISGAGEPNRALQAMNSLEDHLILRKNGLIMLLTPPFNDGDMEPGYIKGYVPGVRENGGQYTHAAAWAIIAFALLGEGDKAEELFELISPINHTKDARGYALYKVEPYVIAADVYAVYPNEGRGGWSWYTGAAGWMYRAGLEAILGFQKNGSMLVMEPCIPSKWLQYTIRYQYMDTDYTITVQNPDGVCRGLREIRMDDTISQGNTIQLVNDGLTHNVLVIMGERL